MKHKIAVTFIIGAVILLGIISYAIKPKEGEVYDIISTREKLEEVEQEKTDTLDVLFAGDSLVFRAISPLKIWELTGITSYDLSDGAMRLCDQDAMIRETCRNQKPKLIVLEAHIMTNEASPFKDDFAIPTNLIERAFPIFHYHVFYKAFHPFDDDNRAIIRKGYKPDDGIVPYEGSLEYMEEEADPVTIKPLNQKYLEDIAGYCKDNDIELLVLALPSPLNYDKEKHKDIQAWSDEHGVDFLDMNYVWEDIGIDWNTDTKDGGDHMNPAGAMKVSTYLAEYLDENYDLTDHRDDEYYAEWNRDHNELSD